MTAFKEEFKFLEDGIDVPFYNDLPKLSIFDWLIVLAAVLLMIGYITVLDIPNEYLPWAYFLTGVIPALYICKGNYSLFFKKLKLKDIKLIILCVIAIYVYTIAVGAILSSSIGMAAHTDFAESGNLMNIICTIFQVMGEEFFKIFMLLILMYVLYKLTGNRNASLAIGLFGSMAIFGLAHYNAYEGRILQILLIQGLGSIFEYYGYLKTKNVWVSYLIHIIRDLIPTALILLNVVPVT